MGGGAGYVPGYAFAPCETSKGSVLATPLFAESWSPRITQAVMSDTGPTRAGRGPTVTAAQGGFLLTGVDLGADGGWPLKRRPSPSRRASPVCWRSATSGTQGETGGVRRRRGLGGDPDPPPAARHRQRRLDRGNAASSALPAATCLGSGALGVAHPAEGRVPTMRVPRPSADSQWTWPPTARSRSLMFVNP